MEQGKIIIAKEVLKSDMDHRIHQHPPPKKKPRYFR